MSEFTLQRTGMLPLRISGDLLAATDSRRSDAVRWSEISIYRVSDGRYVVYTIGRTTHLNEKDRFNATICSDVVGVIDALKRSNGRFTDIALRALSEAGGHDPKLAAASAEKLS